jgi:hypothetical protein
MNDLSSLADVAEIIGVIIVIGGLVFAVLQMRQARQQRRELAAIELFRFFGNARFSAAYKVILYLPDDMSAEDIRAKGDKLENAAMLISATMENIGVMTYQRIVPFSIVNNLIGSSVITLWRKLAPWATTLRKEIDSPYAFEWFQWLAERLDEVHDDDLAPAYEAFSSWLPTNINQGL